MTRTEPTRLRIRRTLRLGRAIRLVWQTARGWTAANALLLAVQGFLPLLTLYLTKLMIDSVVAGTTAPDKSAAFGRVASLLAWTGLVALASALVRSASDLISENQAMIVTDRISDILHEKSVEIDLAYYENPKYFDTLHRAQQEAPSRPTHIVNGLAQVGMNGLSLAAMAGLLVTLHWLVAMVLFIAVVPGIFVRMRYSGKLYRWQREKTQTERKSWYYHWMLTGDQHAKEIRLFDLGGLFRERFRGLRRILRGEKMGLSRRRAIADLIAQIGSTAAIYGSYAFITFRTVRGDITIGDLFMYFQAFQRGQGYLQQLLAGMAGLYEDNLFLSNFYEFLDIRPGIRPPSNPRSFPKPIQTGIRFDHVAFSYPGGGRKVFSDLSLSIGPGEHVALVGNNGAGKTTLIKLLCRLYDPDQGDILLDGAPLREYDPAALRREISVILQDYSRYHASARENIWFGDVAIARDDGRILEAAARAGADSVLDGLPKGIDTLLGKWFEEGEELSIGEWQKLALARAFLRSAQILVLDEPTSSLDAKSEYEVFRRFRELAKGRTALLISHRFSTVRMADRIMVIEKGSILENGSHEELIRKAGTYAQMFEAQARNYR
ncbi:MAG: ABC transporter ATP-binding protein [bacterium]|nr:ABC transporter ATP-binding protein [bacterium]